MLVTAGAWIDARPDSNAREVTALIEAARTMRHIERVMVGNEAILRGDVTVDELIVYLDQVRKAIRKPVSTAEPWHVLAALPGARQARRLHHRAPAAVSRGPAGRQGGGVRLPALRRGRARASAQEDRGRRSRLAEPRPDHRRRHPLARQPGALRTRVPRPSAHRAHRLLPDGGDRPAVEGGRRRLGRPLLGHVQRRPRGRSTSSRAWSSATPTGRRRPATPPRSPSSR